MACWRSIAAYLYRLAFLPGAPSPGAARIKALGTQVRAEPRITKRNADPLRLHSDEWAGRGPFFPTQTAMKLRLGWGTRFSSKAWDREQRMLGPSGFSTLSVRL